MGNEILQVQVLSHGNSIRGFPRGVDKGTSGAAPEIGRRRVGAVESPQLLNNWRPMPLTSILKEARKDGK